MTKRASLGASSVSDVHTKSARKSPTTSSMTYTEPPSPAPYQLFPQRRESQERRSSSSSQKTSSFVSPSRTLERCGSVLHPLHSPQDRNRLTSPLSHSVICSSSSPPSVTEARDSDEERGGFGLSSVHLLPISYSPISTLSDSVATPALAAFSLHAESQDCSNPCTTPFPVVNESSPSTLAAGPEPPTRPSSPPDNSITTDCSNLALKRSSSFLAAQDQ